MGVVGSSGLVGQTFLKLATTLPYETLCFGRKSSQLSMDDLLVVQPDFCVFLTPEAVSRQYIPKLAKLGCVSIDNSSAFRLEKDVPLFVPEINGDTLSRLNKIVANPNCTTIQIVYVLNALKSLDIKRVFASTYQAVSGGGKDALEDLIFARGEGQTIGLPHEIANNFFPLIGKILPNGNSTEEEKVQNECRKILQKPKLKVESLAVRVPVSNCHGVALAIDFDKDFDLNQAKELLRRCPTIILEDCPMPIVAVETPYVFVGRLKKQGKRLTCFCVADNLWRGASYNALEILKLLEKLYV